MIPVKEILFYKDHRFIFFEDLLSEEQIEKLKSTAMDTVKGETFSDLYCSGFDVWRRSALFKKIAFNRQFYDIVHQLTDIKPLGIGFDHWITNTQYDNATSPFLLQNAAIEEFSPYQQLAAIMIFNLGETEIPDVLNTDFPVGSCLILAPDHRWCWDSLLKELDTRNFYIVGICQKITVFTAKRNTPLSSLVETQLGYTIGDHIIHKKNPFLLK